MGKKTAWISFAMLIIFVTVGVVVVNIRLNRRIYSDIIVSIDDKEEESNNEKDIWNLDYMEEVLSNPDYYKEVDNSNLFDNLDEDIPTINIMFAKDEYGAFSFNSVPAIRMLFNKEPFDLRISLDNYILTFNKESLDKLFNLKKLKNK